MFWADIFMFHLVTGSSHFLGSLYVYGKLPTYPSPKPTFCPKWEVSVDVD